MKQIKNDSKIEFWNYEEITDSDEIYFLNLRKEKDKNEIIIEHAYLDYGYHEDYYDFIIKSGQAHKTKESALLYYNTIMHL